MTHPLKIPLHSPDWSPFLLVKPEEFPPSPRDIRSKEGKGDRLRSAAFAELQAREAFLWAAEAFEDAPASLKEAWKGLSLAEDRHLSWILKRIQELEISIPERPVSGKLWESFGHCKTSEEFAIYIGAAEDRGRQAANRFVEALRESDPQTAEIFRKIAEEEIEHIALVQKHFPGKLEAHLAKEKQKKKTQGLR